MTKLLKYNVRMVILLDLNGKQNIVPKSMLFGIIHVFILMICNIKNDLEKKQVAFCLCESENRENIVVLK